MSVNTLTFHLYRETMATTARNDGETAAIKLDGPVVLEAQDAQLAVVQHARSGCVALERIIVHQEALLAMTTADDSLAMRVNGVLAGPVQLLRAADVVEFPDEGPLLHVALFAQPYCGTAQEEHVGKECPVCLTTIEPEVRVLGCLHCEAVMHMGDESTANPGESLDCARLSPHCPVCSRPLVREEGYVYVPDI